LLPAKDIIAEIIDLGFERAGRKSTRAGTSYSGAWT